MSEENDDGIPASITMAVESLTQKFDETVLEPSIASTSSIDHQNIDTNNVILTTPTKTVRSSTTNGSHSHTKGGASPGHRLYDQHAAIQAKLALKREQSKKSDIDNNPYSPQLIAKRKSRTSPAQQRQEQNSTKAYERLYNMSKTKKQPPVSPSDDTISVSSKKISGRGLGNMYDRSLTHLARKEMRLDELERELTPSFAPRLESKDLAGAASVPVADRLYNPNWRQDRDLKLQKQQENENKQYTFQPQIVTKKSPSQIKSPPSDTAAWKRLYDLSASKKNKLQSCPSPEETFRPDIRKSQVRVSVPGGYQPIHQRASPAAGTRAKAKSFVVGTGTGLAAASPKKQPRARATSLRLEQLYQSGIRKAEERKTFEKTVNNRREESDLAQCTFQPKTKWGHKEPKKPSSLSGVSVSSCSSSLVGHDNVMEITSPGGAADVGEYEEEDDDVGVDERIDDGGYDEAIVAQEQEMYSDEEEEGVGSSEEINASGSMFEESPKEVDGGDGLDEENMAQEQEQEMY